MKAYPETHQHGYISIENLPDKMNQGFTFNPISLEGDFGIQIAKDGRVWVCINGIAFIRFKPDILKENLQPFNSQST